MIYLATILGVAADQLSKWAVLFYLPEQHFIPITSFFNLFLTYNKGVTFSFFASDSAYRPWILSAVAFAVCIGVVYWIHREPNTKTRWALAAILGGAIGNLIDRVRIGKVVDFLDFHLGAYHWPTFNVADIIISCGAVLLFVQLFLDKKEKK